MSREVITRRNLPHWFVPGAIHFVTFRLAGTIPRHVLEEMKQRKEQLLTQKPPSGFTVATNRERVHKKLFAMYDQYLDTHREIDWLANPQIAATVRSSLYHLNGKAYELLCYCIMPNHVHMLILPRDMESNSHRDLSELEPGEQHDGNSPLSSIMHGVKSYTAHEANKLLRRKGQFWQHESYDHWVRDEEELERIVAYINGNPVKAGLAVTPQDWYWSSAHDRYLMDGDTTGWLGRT